MRCGWSYKIRERTNSRKIQRQTEMTKASQSKERSNTSKDKGRSDLGPRPQTSPKYSKGPKCWSRQASGLVPANKHPRRKCLVSPAVVAPHSRDWHPTSAAPDACGLHSPSRWACQSCFSAPARSTNLVLCTWKCVERGSHVVSAARIDA